MCVSSPLGGTQGIHIDFDDVELELDDPRLLGSIPRFQKGYCLYSYLMSLLTLAITTVAVPVLRVHTASTWWKKTGKNKYHYCGYYAAAKLVR